MPTLHSDAVKNKLMLAIHNALNEAKGELEIEQVSFHESQRNSGDENHVVRLQMEDGSVFSILVKYGDYTACAVEPSRGPMAIAKDIKVRFPT